MDIQDAFRFKKFKVVQDHSVHRVGTDGVLLGAWVNLADRKKILDVGTGTGVIALLVAQRSNTDTLIIAIEPDAHSYNIAATNISSSSFVNRMEIINCSFQQFNQAGFDLIVCNPPFFENSLKPPRENRTRERHSESLPSSILIKKSNELLNDGGRISVVLPVKEGEIFIMQARKTEFEVTRLCEVYSKSSKPVERLLIELTKQQSQVPTRKEQLIIMNNSGEFTEQYKELTKDFYLNF